MQCLIQPTGYTRGAKLCQSRRKLAHSKKKLCSVRPSVRSHAVKTDPRHITETASVEALVIPETTRQLTIDKPENIMNTLAAGDLVQETALEPAAESGFLGRLWTMISDGVASSPRVRGLIMLNVMTLIMSTNFVAVKEAESLMDPFSFCAARFIVAAIPFLPFLAKMKPDKETLHAGAELGIWSALAYLTQGVGLLTTDAARISFLSALTVILVPLIVGFSGRGVSKMVYASAATAMLGVSLLSGTGVGGSMSVGDIMGLASAGFIAMQVIRTEHYCRVLPAKKRFAALGVSVLSIAACSSLAACGAHADVVLSGIQHLDTLTPQSLISMVGHLPKNALLYTGFLSTDLVLLLELVALKDVESTDAAIIYTMEPVLGALWAYLLLGERWGPNGWIGAGLILASSFVTQVYGSREQTEPEAQEQSA